MKIVMVFQALTEMDQCTALGLFQLTLLSNQPLVISTRYTNGKFSRNYSTGKSFKKKQVMKLNLK